MSVRNDVLLSLGPLLDNSRERGDVVVALAATLDRWGCRTVSFFFASLWTDCRLEEEEDDQTQYCQIMAVMVEPITIPLTISRLRPLDSDDDDDGQIMMLVFLWSISF
jgi:hypothetical protein